MQKSKQTDFNLRDFLIRNIYMFSAVLVILVFYLINPSFLSLYSIQNITLEMAPLLPMACGLAGVWGFLAKAAFRLGATWGWQLALCIALIALGASALVMGLKKKAK